MILCLTVLTLVVIAYGIYAVLGIIENYFDK